MQLEELILIDQLEDQIIDHPDASTKEELNESLDETFQKKLNARASQIRSTNNEPRNQTKETNQDSSSVNYQFLITKSHLNYEYQDYSPLDQEISEWFTLHDLKIIGGLNNLIHCYDSESGNIENIIVNIKSTSKIQDLSSNQVKALLYFSFGEYASQTTKTNQLDQIKRNNLRLLQKEVYIPLIMMLETFILERIEFDKLHDEAGRQLCSKLESEYFRILTLLFFMISTALEHRQNAIKFKRYLFECDFLTTLLKFIEHWKWYPSGSHRIRYLILLVNKLLFLELGDSSQLKECDDFLVKLHNVQNKKSKTKLDNTLTCSPLDYFVFREDLLDKYPLYDENELKPYDFSAIKKALDEDDTNDDTSSINSHSSTIEGKYRYFMAVHSSSNSLSNLIEPPKTNKSHSSLSKLPTQTIHIATPVPSPQLMASDYMSGGEKIRRSYQLNQAMPMIYPTDDNNNLNVPYAMKVADEILKKAVYESYSTKRLWKEREIFMKQERGFSDVYEDEEGTHKDEFEYDYEQLMKEFPDRQQEIESIERVELLYSRNLSRLHTIVEVLMETIKVNRLDYNLNFTELELNPETSIIQNKNSRRNEDTKRQVELVLLLQLEVNNVKELTLKASTSIILLLLKWFKISHVLKSYYFSSLLFDQQFFTISLDYLSRCFNNANLQSTSTTKKDELTEYEILINQNKLMNPKIMLPKCDFFNNCLQQEVENHKYVLINKSFIQDLKEEIDENNVNHVYISDFNDNFAYILSNMLKITNKILIKNQSQRIFTLNDLKPTELYKMILLNYECDPFNQPILRTLKKLIPYQGRKWKAANMDLISQIYLNLKLSMKDNWLSGKDLESDFNNSFDQEIALRGLLQFYNVRRYPAQMEMMGYQVKDDLMNIPQLDLNVMNEIVGDSEFI